MTPRQALERDRVDELGVLPDAVRQHVQRRPARVLRRRQGALLVLSALQGYLAHKKERLPRILQ